MGLTMAHMGEVPCRRNRKPCVRVRKLRRVCRYCVVGVVIGALWLVARANVNEVRR